MTPPKPSSRWRSSRRCSGAGRSSSPVTCGRFRAGQLGNVANQIGLPRSSPLATLYSGARLVMEGDLTIGQLVAFNMLAGRVSGPILRVVQLVAGLPADAGVDREAGRDPQFARRAGSRSRQRAGCRDQGRRALRSRELPLSHRRPGPSRNPSTCGRRGHRHRRPFRLRQEHVLETDPAAVRARIRPRVHRWHRPRVDRPSSLRRQIGVVLQENVVFRRSVRENIALADPARRSSSHGSGQARGRP